jgi:hypothetical protein
MQSFIPIARDIEPNRDIGTYEWNYADHVVVGAYDDFHETLKHRRIRYLTPDLDHTTTFFSPYLLLFSCWLLEDLRLYHQHCLHQQLIINGGV